MMVIALQKQFKILPESNTMNPQIVVLDFGGQYCHLIARRVRDFGVYSEVVPSDTTAKELKEKCPLLKGIILSGGPASIGEKGAPKMDEKILEIGVPVLSLCYGHQLLATILGGKLGVGKQGEYGLTNILVNRKSRILAGLEKSETVWMNHRDSVVALPVGFSTVASSEICEVAAYENTDKKIFGLQFHPEVTHTKCGKKIFENFVFNICSAKKDWSMEDFIEKTVASIKEQAKGRRAVLGLSGGVDSSTVAALVGRAIGKNLTAVFVDTGFMRKNETEFIKGAFGKQDIGLKMIDAKKRFYSAMKGVEDPEKKRKIIGKLFIDIFNEEAKKTGAKILVQGTIYPDRIESGATKNSTVIKSHHNVGGLPKEMKLELMEPLQDLYKDEVRKVAEKLGMPKELAWRHPFPGPGLAVRILGECTPEDVKILQEADYILLDELKKSEWYDKIWQAFAVLLPVKSVGVQGDARSYKSVIALRMVNSVDGMTADFSKVPHEVLEKISSRITNEVKEVGRVVYDITNKPPGTIEWE